MRGVKFFSSPGRRRCVQCSGGTKTGSNSINLRRGKNCGAAAAVCAMIYGGHRWRGQGTNLFIVRITFYYQVVRRGSPSTHHHKHCQVYLPWPGWCQYTSRWDQVLSCLSWLSIVLGAVTPSGSRTGDSGHSMWLLVTNDFNRSWWRFSLPSVVRVHHV